MLIKLTQVRSGWKMPKNGEEGHEVRYTTDLWVNPVLVQFLCAAVKPEAELEAYKSVGPEHTTILGFGPDAEFYVLESVDLVLNLIAGAAK